jgi:hypothetical protein
VIFYGILAAFFYTFLIGAIWPARKEAYLSEALLGYLGKSLWLSWILVAISYWLKLPDLFLLVFVVCSLIVFLQSRADLRNVTIAGDFLRLAGAAVINSVFLFVCWQRLASGDYDTIFKEWDAVVSWNQWATELFQNRYEPYNAAYPVLFPAIWSLVYKAQGDASVWFMAKFTLFSVPAALGLSAIALMERYRFLSAIIMSVFVTTFFFQSHLRPMLSGYMDIPVTALMLVTAVCMFLAAMCFQESRGDEARSYLRLGAFFSGLSATTKQPGVIIIVLFLIQAAYYAINKRLKIRYFLGIFLIAALPPAVYLIIYLQLIDNVVGNLEELRHLALERAKEEGIYWVTYRAIVSLVGPGALLALMAAALLNFRNLGGIDGLIGLAFLAGAIGGALIYANCCSYDVRDGWWITSVLVPSALFGLSTIDSVFGRRFAIYSTIAIPAVVVPVTILLAAIATAAVTAISLPEDRVRLIQAESQWEIATPSINELIRSKLDVLGDDGMLVASYVPAGWLPSMKNRYTYCALSDAGCVRRVARTSPRILILMRTQDEGDVSPELRPLLSRAKLLGMTPHNRAALYGPFGAGEFGVSEQMRD